MPLLAGFADDIKAGLVLAEAHVGHESVEPFAGLKYDWKEGKPVSWRVEKMRLSKDKSALVVNESLTLTGIPAEVFGYRLGNRSALEWVIDQYQVDPKTGEDPNRPDDPQYIVNLVRRVVTVSLRTVSLVAGLPPWPDSPPPADASPS